MASFKISVPSSSPKQDTEYLHQALRNWQERTHSTRTWDQLSQTLRSEILSDAQNLKVKDSDDDELMLERRLRLGPLTVEEVLDSVEQKRRQDSKLFSPVTEEEHRS